MCKKALNTLGYTCLCIGGYASSTVLDTPSTDIDLVVLYNPSKGTERTTQEVLSVLEQHCDSPKIKEHHEPAFTDKWYCLVQCQNIDVLLSNHETWTELSKFLDCNMNQFVLDLCTGEVQFIGTEHPLECGLVLYNTETTTRARKEYLLNKFKEIQ